MDIAYLLFFPLAIIFVLMVHVYFQNPKGVGNRLFAIFMANIAVATCALLTMSTTRDPALAGAMMVLLLVTSYLLNAPFMLMLVLLCFYPRSRLFRYGVPILFGLAGLFSIGLIGDWLAQAGIFYTPSPELGQGYLSVKKVLLGPLGFVPRAWLLACMGGALVLLVVAWVRARRSDRRPIAIFGGAFLVVGMIMPIVPENPLFPMLPALLFSLTFTFMINRYRFFLPAGIALEAVFHSSGEGMVICDSEGRVEQANPAAEGLTGVPMQRARGQPLAMALAPLLPRVQHEEGTFPLAEALARGSGKPASVQVRLEGAEPRVLTLSTTPIQDGRGRLLGGLLALRDVSERERVRQLLESEQEQRQRLEATTADLEWVVAQTRATASSLAAASAEILAATTQQASGAGEQSAAITQASTTIDQVQAIAAQAAQQAESVVAVAQRTLAISQTGQQAVVEAIAGMEVVKQRVETISNTILALSEQTQAIGGIIATVGEIAKQSNLLALNAAVEAARAGEAGRGFAVVAGEVRALAERSRAATMQVKELLPLIQNGVNSAVLATEEGLKGAQAGTRLTGEAGIAITRLAESVTDATRAAERIAAAAGQQRVGMEQLASAVANIQKVTAQTLASTRQTERTATDLNGLAGQLNELVGQF